MKTLLAAIGVSLLCAVATGAHADTMTVTNTNDSGQGSLRQAIIDANDGDTIVFDLGGATPSITLLPLVVPRHWISAIPS